jgi:hypothetical protein
MDEFVNVSEVVPLKTCVDLLMQNLRLSSGLQSAGLPYLSLQIDSVCIDDSDSLQLRYKVENAIREIKRHYQNG